MKKYSVIYLAKAQRDLTDLLEYIKRDSPKNAKAWVVKIDKTLERLAQFPASGTVPRDERLAAQGYRMVIIGEYLVFYIVRGPKIEIHRVLHGRQRYSFLL